MPRGNTSREGRKERRKEGKKEGGGEWMFLSSLQVYTKEHGMQFRICLSPGNPGW